MSSSADRKRRYRERQRQGEMVCSHVVQPCRVERMLNAGLLTDAESQDRAAVMRAIDRLSEQKLVEIEKIGGTRTHRTARIRATIPIDEGD